MAPTRRSSTLIATIVAALALVGCGDSADPVTAEPTVAQTMSGVPTLYDPLEAEIDIRTDPSASNASTVSPSSGVYAVLMIEMHDLDAKFEADIDVTFGSVSETGTLTPTDQRTTQASITGKGEVAVDFGPTFKAGTYYVSFQLRTMIEGYESTSYSHSFDVEESSPGTSASPAAKDSNPSLFEPWLADAELKRDLDVEGRLVSPFDRTETIVVVATVETRNVTDSIPVQLRTTWTSESDGKIVKEDEVAGNASGNNQWTFEAGPFPAGTYGIVVHIGDDSSGTSIGLSFVVE
ncbi:hypothetical protein JGU71_08695 [Antrihabitans sp. YC3-6]|uniref:Uncharacterized protein n=1 Tax=Antrihabitans stalagmiti TaxID=2799499 RepID=A0A934NPM8_9NOCA|nr:hypothetical protein [Antrihabitans stalagmiti]MBJ8338960.1 hypothetical protein [Antrihabitans stalagmiti]